MGAVRRQMTTSRAQDWRDIEILIEAEDRPRAVRMARRLLAETMGFDSPEALQVASRVITELAGEGLAEEVVLAA